jgi:two-component system cell cycle sensor histidine kinase/response regulator CckA
MTPFRILLLEDNESDAKLIVIALRRALGTVFIRRIETLEDLRASLDDQEWDIILSDWTMPRMSALTALACLKSTDLDVPFIVVSGSVGEETAVEAMRQGAHDYVLKGNLSRLGPAILREVRECRVRKANQSAAASLREQEARLRAMVERSTEGVLFMDRHGLTTYASPAGRRLLGLVGEQEAGHAVIESIHPENKSEWQQFLEGLLVYGHPMKGEFRLGAAAQGGMWLEFTGMNMLNEPPVNALVMNVRDVTERHLILEHLMATELRLMRLMDSGVVAIVVAEISGRNLEANDAYLEMLGYSREDLEAGELNWTTMTPEAWRDQDLGAFDELRRTGAATPWEKEMYRKDGTRVPVSIAVAMLDERRCIALLSSQVRRKEAEADVKEKERQLRQAQKMEAIGLLAGGIAHDFNNLLCVVLTYSSLLLEDTPSDDQRHSDVEAIHRAGVKAAELTRQLLVFTRQQASEDVVLDLNAVLTELERMLRRVVAENIEVRLRLAADLPRVEADPSLLEQVLMNLIVNACDAQPDGGFIEITTDHEYLTPERAQDYVGLLPGRYVRLSVADAGTGMDQATMDRIFDPFFTTKDIGKGTGLGLSIVFGIVKQSGGAIAVRSELGKGTTFEVYLPVTEKAEPHSQARKSPESLSGTETILLVDDDGAVRAAGETVLRRRGYRVISAAGGAQALEALGRHGAAIHLVITDVVMPLMSGIELARRVCELLPQAKVLFMSGYPDDTMGRGQGPSSLRHPVLSKPLTPDTLARRVREILDGT